MGKFVGRQRELTELNAVLDRGGAQFILVYGRRRVGKTTLVLHWAEQTGRPVIYWVAHPRYARSGSPGLHSRPVGLGPPREPGRAPF
ncbi:MAG: ATP-binding protein [Anaerolineae bacterium]